MRKGSDCKEMILLGTAVAFEMGKDLTAEELAKLSGLFYIIADELALMSLCAPEIPPNRTLTDEEAVALY